MSIKHMKIAFEHPSITPAQCLVLLAIAWHANEKGECFPHVATLARETKFNAKTVSQACTQLVEIGLINRRFTRNGNIYHFAEGNVGISPTPKSHFSHAEIQSQTALPQPLPTVMPAVTQSNPCHYPAPSQPLPTVMPAVTQGNAHINPPDNPPDNLSINPQNNSPDKNHTPPSSSDCAGVGEPEPEGEDDFPWFGEEEEQVRETLLRESERRERLEDLFDEFCEIYPNKTLIAGASTAFAAAASKVTDAAAIVAAARLVKAEGAPFAIVWLSAEGYLTPEKPIATPEADEMRRRLKELFCEN